jgi:hypothetical protein
MAIHVAVSLAIELDHGTYQRPLASISQRPKLLYVVRMISESKRKKKVKTMQHILKKQQNNQQNTITGCGCRALWVIRLQNFKVVLLIRQYRQNILESQCLQ